MALTEAEIAERVNSIGASEVAAVLGLNEWQSPHQVWLSKMGLATFKGNDATEAGNDFEATILARCAKHNGLVLLPSRKVVGPESWLTATPDAFIAGGGLAEAKMVGFQQMWQWSRGGGGVPYTYLCQVQMQLFCTGEPYCIVAAQMGTEHHYYRVEPDTELQALIVDGLRHFWFSYVVHQVPPPIDGSDGAKEMLQKLYPRSARAMRTATDTEEALAARITSAEVELKKQAEDVSCLKNLMRQSVTDWESIRGDGWKVRYKSSSNGQRPFYFEQSKGGK